MLEFLLDESMLNLSMQAAHCMQPEAHMFRQPIILGKISC